MSMMDVLTDPTYVPCWYFVLWVLLAGYVGGILAELTIKFERYIKRRLKHKDGDQHE